MGATVHTYRSGERGLFINSYLVEGGDGVVAIDAPLLMSDRTHDHAVGGSGRP